VENIIKEVTPKNMSNIMLDSDAFIKLYNENKVELVDVRADMEVKAWQLNFGLQIPANELPDRLNELPKDKIIVCACPKSDRSIIARTYLASIGIQSKYLRGGLLDLMDRLKGGKVKDINIF